MMGNIPLAVLVLSIMIFIHELGHFLAAKKMGVGVEKFSIGFGPRLWGFRRGDTEYLLSAIPFGGYVKMVGDNPDEEVEDRESSFLLKPVWKRMLIVFAGPVFNLLSAVLIIYIVYLAGVPALLPVIGTVQEGSPAFAAGLEPGDRITAVDGAPVEIFDDLPQMVGPKTGTALRFDVLRDGEELTFTITPRSSKSENLFGEAITVGQIGITPSGDTKKIRYGAGEALGMSFQWTWGMIRLTMTGIVKMVQGVVPADNLGGPLMIVQFVGKSAEQGILNLLYFTAYISVALGLFNLFPIPILDGGHILFFAIEAVKGEPVSERKREIAQQVGLVLLVALMLYATKNDIFRYIAEVKGNSP